MPRYEVDLDDGRRFEIEVDQDIPDTDAGRSTLARLVERELAFQRATRNTAGSLLGQAIGGVRDAVQGAIDTVPGIANTVTEFLSPDPPGGPRRRVVPEVQTPQLPDTEPPQTGLEQGVRIGTTVATDLAAGLLAPGVRERAARLLFGEPPTVRPAPLMFEPGRPVARSAPAGQKLVPTLAVPGASQELSEGAMRLAQLFDIPFRPQDIQKMTLDQALHAKGRLVNRLSPYDYAELMSSDTPVAELIQAIEAQILRYR
jgi:hypothetical protein